MTLRVAPFLVDLQSYSARLFRADVQAGVTVAVFAVPQAMAYAMLAGVAPVYGLYAAIVMSIVGALWGSSPWVNTGPTNSAALLTAAALVPYAGNPDYMLVVFTLCFLVGVVRFAMGAARMGVLLDYVPESAFLGFTVGAGLLIALGQVHHLLGVTGPEASWFPAQIVETVGHLPGLNPYALAIGSGTLVLMLVLDRWSRRFPVALLAIGLATLAAWLLGEGAGVRLVRDVAAIPVGLPGLTMPSFDPGVMRDLLPAALAISLIGLIEAASIGQTLALRRGRALDVNQEFIGQGLSHIVGAFFSGIPGSGSFGRSLLMEATGGRTRFANVVFGVALLSALLAIPGLLERIPVTSLAGLLVYVGIRLVDAPRIRRVFTTSAADAAILVLTFGVTVLYRIEYGIFAGILGAALVHLHRTRELHLVEYVPDETGRLKELGYDAGTVHDRSDLVVVGVTGDLYYGISMELRRKVNDLIQAQQPTHLILRVRRATTIDYSCWSALFDVAEAFHRTGGRLYLCGIREGFEDIVRASGLGDALPVEQLYPATEAPFEAFDRCLADVLRAIETDSPRLSAWRMRGGGARGLSGGG